MRYVVDHATPENAGVRFGPHTGEGLGASHQTGWTGLVANLIHEWRG